MARKEKSELGKQEKFVDAYIETMNPQKAAEMAGYSHPHVMAYRVLNNPKVKEALKERRGEMMLRHGINPDAVLKEYARIAFSSLNDIFEIKNNTVVLKQNADLSLLSEVNETPTGLKIKLHDKKGALDALSRHLGLFEADNKQIGEALAVSLREQIEAGAKDAKAGGKK